MDGTILGKKYDIINGSGGGGGTDDYEKLSNLPKINSVELKGNKSISDLGIDAEHLSYDNTDSSLVATNVQAAIDEMVVNFQDGVDDVYDACVAKGSTPASHSLSDVIAAIGNIASGGTLTVLRTGIGSGSDITVNQSFTMTNSGYIMATGYMYMNNMTLAINSGANLLTKDGYTFTDNTGYHAVSEGDVVTFSGDGTGRCYDYMTLLFTDAVMPS